MGAEVKKAGGKKYVADHADLVAALGVYLVYALINPEKL